MKLVVIRLFLISFLMNSVSSEMALGSAFFSGAASLEFVELVFFVSLLTEPCDSLLFEPPSQETKNG